jgi:hypothetical protein
MDRDLQHSEDSDDTHRTFLAADGGQLSEEEMTWLLETVLRDQFGRALTGRAQGKWVPIENTSVGTNRHGLAHVERRLSRGGSPSHQRARWCSITPRPPCTAPTPGSAPVNVPNGWR